MTGPLTTLVLTPSLGGDFFGDIVAGLAREVVDSGGRILVVETRLENSPRDEAGEPGDFDTPVAWSKIDGVVSVTTAAGETYLARLQERGLPVVLLSSTQVGQVRAPVARPDNRAGIRAAVDHLVAHGHERIGFMGNLAQRDVSDRHDAFVEALEARGVTLPAAYLLRTADNGEQGGAEAARTMLDAPERPTALVIATDRNAIGAMRALAEAGIDVPDDLAIVSFDNGAASTFTAPALTSIDPRFDEVGALAARLVLARIEGADVPDRDVTPGAAELKVRSSCGCDAETRIGPPMEAHDDEQPTRRADEALRATLIDILGRELRTGDEAADVLARETAAALARDAAQLVALGNDASSARLRDFTRTLLATVSRPDTVRRVIDATLDHAHASVERARDEGSRRSALPSRLEAALWKAQSRAFLRHAERTDEAIAEQYAVDAGLLATAGADPRDLAWLRDTSVVAGALALWQGAPADGRLAIVGEYCETGGALGLVGSESAVEDFPPEELMARASAAERQVCVVVPVRTPELDWGLLAVVVAIDPTTARDTHQHWAALLSAALESRRRQDEVERSALFDALTGLPNRRLFVERIEEALACRRRSGTPFSVLFLDLDGFKLVNDSLGHQMGDRVLKAVADDLATQVREVDTAARFGGDEFVILLADTDPDSATVVAQRVQDALSQVRVFDGHEVVTRASIGIASSVVGYETADEVLRDADAAMYRAKTSEPGTVSYFDVAMHESAARRAALAKDVLRALEEQQFEVHYQPIVTLDSGRTDRFEALVRWRHPERGLIEPDEFLTEIEETSLIVQLGHWVLEQVCAQMAAWAPRVAGVSINISDKEFWSQDLQSRVLGTLEEHGIPPHLLTLEITESVLMRRPEMALRIMHRLHDAGLRLHIDDFGTGYSSLETLHRFPVEAFKIDRTFIQGLTDVENSAELISSLVKLGRALGLAVVAEGVETEEQLAFLQDLGCATGQGFLFMPAVTAEHATALLGHSLHEADASERHAPPAP